MKTSLRFGILGVAATLCLSACGEPPNSNDQSARASASEVKACMVSDSGGFDDKSFNQSGHEGLMRARDELGVSVDQAESQSEADFVPNIENMVQGGCDIIMGVGFLMAGAMTEVAEKNPDVKFALVDSDFEKELENGRPLLFNTAEAAYLGGYASAAMSQTGKVGAYLGRNIPSTSIFADGFSDGVDKYNEEKGTDVQMIGWDKANQNGMVTGNFEDQAKGKQFTEQLFEQGVDIVMPVAGPVGLGSLAAAQESDDKMIVWIDADGFVTESRYGNVILTSVVKEIGASVVDAVKAVVDGTFDSEAYVGTLENDGVSLAPWHDFADKVPTELDKELDALRKEIIDGTIVVESVSMPRQ